MRLNRYLFGATLVCVALLFSPTSFSGASTLLIQNVHIVSSQGVSELSDVLIEGETITAVGKSLQPKLETQDVQVIDGRGQYLSPGLIDSHVHLRGVPGESDAMPAQVRDEAVAQIPKSYLYFGFTTLLDLISEEQLIAQWNSQPLSPTAYHCVGVPVPGGYPMAWLPKDEQMSSPIANYYLYDENQPELMQATDGSERHKPAALVERIAKTDAKCIKTFYETGFGRLRNLPVPSHDSMRTLIAEAHKQHLQVFMHGNSRDSYLFAIATGVDVLAHGPWHGVTAQDDKALQALALQVRDANIAIQPTIQVVYGERELFGANFFAREDVQAALPSALRRWYQSSDGQWFVHDMSHSFGGPDVPHLHEKVDKAYANPIGSVQAFTRVLAGENGDLIFGSDTPSGPIYTQFPGLNGYQEIQRWGEAGVSPRQIFNSLTSRNAKLLGLSEVIGSVAKGRRADLLLMRKNPLESIAAYDTIEWVVVKGKAIKRSELAAN